MGHPESRAPSTRQGRGRNIEGRFAALVEQLIQDFRMRKWMFGVT